MKKAQDYQYYTYRSRHQYSTNLQSFSRHPLLTPSLLQITPKMLRNPIDKEELKQQLSRKDRRHLCFLLGIIRGSLQKAEVFLYLKNLF